MSKIFDVCIIGGGASGLAAAIYIKQKEREISVAVLERLPRIGKKLIITGNGRCNITNTDESLSHYHGQNPGFAEYALKKYSNTEIENFFNNLGVIFVSDETGRVYPSSLQASSVVDALRFACDSLGVNTFVDCMVTDVTFGDTYTLKTEKGSFRAKNIVFAAGLYSGGVRLGCDGSILRLLKSKGEKSTVVTPAIVQINTETDIVRSLKGIKVNATAAMIINGKPFRSEKGEVLFCDYGLSGPPILQIARAVDREKGEKTVSLDLLPDSSTDEIISVLSSFKRTLHYRNLDEYLSGLLNKRLGQAVIKAAGLKLSSNVGGLSKDDIVKISSLIKNFRIKALSTTGFENSQVTAGGLCTNGFDNKTMMSKLRKGMYAIGEILDIDGDCGGYNLHFAFSSAFCAADSIVKEYKNDKA